MTDKQAKNDNQVAIEKLEKTINEQKKLIRASKFMISQLKNAEGKPFGEGKLARGYFHTIKLLTNPFRTLNTKAVRSLEDPTGVRREQMLEEAKKILNTCEKIEDNTKAKSKAMAIKAATMEVELSAEILRGPWDNGESHIVLLKEQVARLRPSMTEEEKKERKKKLEEDQKELSGMMDKLKELVGISQAQEA